MKPSTKKKIKFIIYLVAFFIVISFFETYGVIGIIIFILAVFGWKLWKMRDSFMVALRSTEIAVWGKPLDKDCWDKKEMKNTKVKVVWGKKGEKDEK